MFILLIIIINYVSYAQTDMANTHYYEQFNDTYWQQESRAALNEALWLIIPGLVIWLAYYLTAGRFNISSVIIFFAIIIIAMIIPIVRIDYIKARLISRENISVYAKNPIRTMKKHPLFYGISQAQVLEMWGEPKVVDKNMLGEEWWFYSRREPVSKGSIWFGGSYVFSYGSFSEWKDLYEISLLFRDGKLVYVEPAIELIRNGKVSARKKH